MCLQKFLWYFLYLCWDEPSDMVDAHEGKRLGRLKYPRPASEKLVWKVIQPESPPRKPLG